MTKRTITDRERADLIRRVALERAIFGQAYVIPERATRMELVADDLMDDDILRYVGGGGYRLTKRAAQKLDRMIDRDLRNS